MPVEAAQLPAGRRVPKDQAAVEASGKDPAAVRGESDSAVVSDARAAGADSPTIFVWLPKANADDLAKAIVDGD